MFLSFAPMEGVTGADYRRLHQRMFGGADVYYAPFLAPDAQGQCKLSHLRALLPESNEGIRLVPQLLVNRPEAFLALAAQLEALGYREINLNAGCPSGTVVSKHKGAGLLADPVALDRLLEALFSRCELRLSVKTRLGMEDAAEFEALLAVYNKYPLSELIVHARTRAGFYRSAPDRAAFFHAAEHCACPLCYNGNVFAPGDLEALPGVDRVMLGRGAAANPALFRQLRGGAPLSCGELEAFHGALLEAALSAGLSEDHAMARMKELWYYMIWMFPGGDKLCKALNKSRRLSDYRAAADALFHSGLFDANAAFGG